MEEPVLHVTRRHLPHWTLAGSTYYVTFHVMQGSFSAAERAVVMDHIRAGQPQFYQLAAAVVMPDHVHLLIKPQPGFSLSRVMKGMKGACARRLNELRSAHGRVWHEESWDRIIRDVAEFEEKLQYMYENPVRRGLVERTEDYDTWYCNPDFA